MKQYWAEPSKSTPATGGKPRGTLRTCGRCRGDASHLICVECWQDVQAENAKAIQAKALEKMNAAFERAKS